MNFLRKLLIRDGRIRFPSRIWLVGIITFLVFALMVPERMLTVLGAATFTAVVFLTTLVEKHPLVSSIAYIAVYILTTQVSAFFNDATIVWLIIFISVVANSGHAKLAWTCAITLLYFNYASFAEGVYLPTDIGSVFTNMIIFSGAILIGLSLHNES